jgi:hypothetical protein
LFGSELGPHTQYPDLDDGARRLFERLVSPIGAALEKTAREVSTLLWVGIKDAVREQMQRVE